MIGLNRILLGDAHQMLCTLPDGVVDCVVTSPPYFQLRNYQHSSQLGLEEHVQLWVNELRGILAETRRVLVATGSVWLNLGDTYSTGEGAPAKSLLLGPERLALALIEDGWLIRTRSSGRSVTRCQARFATGSPAPGRSSTYSFGSVTTSSTSTRSASPTRALSRPPSPHAAGPCRPAWRVPTSSTAASMLSPSRTRRPPAGKEPRRRLATCDLLIPRRPPRGLPGRTS